MSRSKYSNGRYVCKTIYRNSKTGILEIDSEAIKRLLEIPEEKTNKDNNMSIKIGRKDLSNIQICKRCKKFILFEADHNHCTPIEQIIDKKSKENNMYPNPPRKKLIDNSLSFSELRKANIERLPQFKNSLGHAAHKERDGSDWCPAQWFQAMIGEAGEYANFRKKFERGDIDREVFLKNAKKELADVQIYLDILAYRLGIDLGQATIDKFNEVSDRIGVDVKL